MFRIFSNSWKSLVRIDDFLERLSFHKYVRSQSSVFLHEAVDLANFLYEQEAIELSSKRGIVKVA
jgi:hypothetical protein